MKIDIGQHDFGTICICAIRYCHGRQTYMPSLVQKIVGEYLKKISDKDLRVMIDDCEYQKTFNLYGDESIDKPNWMRWKERLLQEQRDRENTHEKKLDKTNNG